MIAFSQQQFDAFRRTQLDEFVVDAEVFLRQHFAARLRACSSQDVRDAVLRGHALAEARGLTQRREHMIHLACACVCGLFLFDDPRCAWLFHERPDPGNTAAIDNFNIDTFAANLGDLEDWFVDDALADCEALVRAGERSLREANTPLVEVLRVMTPARARLIDSPQRAAFVRAADEAVVAAHVRTRHTLLAWLLGPGFAEDPLCRGVLPFLRAARDEGP